MKVGAWLRAETASAAAPLNAREPAETPRKPIRRKAAVGADGSAVL
jgi:hypothetical protein